MMSFFSCSSSFVSAGLIPALSCFFGLASFFLSSFLGSSAGAAFGDASALALAFGAAASALLIIKWPFFGSRPFTTLQASILSVVLHLRDLLALRRALFLIVL